jgi:hypothetical protein
VTIGHERSASLPAVTIKTLIILFGHKSLDDGELLSVAKSGCEPAATALRRSPESVVRE